MFSKRDLLIYTQGHTLNKPLSLWVMLTSALRILVNNPVKKSFYEEKKK